MDKVVIGIFVVLAAYVYLLLYLWFKYLLKLADRYSLHENTKCSGRMSCVAVLLFAIPIGSVNLAISFSRQAEPWFITLMTSLTLGPAFIVWLRMRSRVAKVWRGREKMETGKQ